MVAVLTHARETKHGSEARKLRIALHLSQKGVADMAAVPVEAIDLFEHNLPLPLDYKRRILRELWAEKTRSGADSVTS